MNGIQKLGGLLLMISMMMSCTKNDQEKIVGKWQNDRDWFQYNKDGSYSSGKDDIKMVDHFKYTLDPERKELNMYTDEKDVTYYLIYEFIGEDTLAVRNAMSSVKTMINFIRVKTTKKD
jgi:hypothetical protein